MSASEPQLRDEILDALDRVRNDDLQFWANLAPDRFVAPFGEAWSPADNLRHLIKSTKPVARALSLPTTTLQEMFGTAENPSVTYRALRERYRARLEGGVDAGEFAPSAVEVPSDRTAWQRELVGQCRDAIVELAGVVARWNEGDLDRYRLPHPLLGELTMREMLMFTLYHYDHHRENVARRIGLSTGPDH